MSLTLQTTIGKTSVPCSKVETFGESYCVTHSFIVQLIGTANLERSSTPTKGPRELRVQVTPKFCQ